MKKWPKQHKVLLVLFLIFLAVAVAAHVALIRPRQQRADQLARTVNEKESEVRAQGWPVNPEELQSVLGQKRKKLHHLNRSTEEIFSRTATTFRTRLTAKLGDEAVEEGPLKLVSYLTRLDYEEDFGEITSLWQELGIQFADEVLQLSQDSVSPQVYQLIFHIWTLERVVDLALEHQLVPVNVPVQVAADVAGAELPAGMRSTEIEEDRYTRQVAQITARPVRGYLLNAEDAAPYVVEFPIAMTVECEMSNLIKFLQDLHNQDTFLPISRMQITKIPPRTESDMLNRLRVEIECSAFLILRKELNETPQSETRVLPRGA